MSVMDLVVAGKANTVIVRQRGFRLKTVKVCHTHVMLTTHVNR